jgi:hypothetical protein
MEPLGGLARLVNDNIFGVGISLLVSFGSGVFGLSGY